MGHEEEGVVQLLVWFVGEKVTGLGLTLQGLVREGGEAQMADRVLGEMGLVSRFDRTLCLTWASLVQQSLS
jgi:hypothetical protein